MTIGLDEAKACALCEQLDVAWPEIRDVFRRGDRWPVTPKDPSGKGRRIREFEYASATLCEPLGDLRKEILRVAKVLNECNCGNHVKCDRRVVVLNRDTCDAITVILLCMCDRRIVHIDTPTVPTECGLGQIEELSIEAANVQ